MWRAQRSCFPASRGRCVLTHRRRGSACCLVLFAAGVVLPLTVGCKHSSRREAASCEELLATCGPAASDDCCRSLLVPGGTFNRGYDGVLYKEGFYPATVSDFHLDKYEVTVGRFRGFVNAGLGTKRKPPQEGSGAHPKVPRSGWSSTWNANLAADTATLKAALKCDPIFATWTDEPGDNESKPIECLDWYTAFAFCTWDGGRLPTYAEWNYAASGGSEHRYYPWSVPATSEALDDSYAVYCGTACIPQNVGTKSPKGDAKWGQSDLAGNAWEWTLDYSPKRYILPCTDCAEVTVGSYRVFLGGSNNDIESTLLSASRHISVPEYRGVIGARCARAR
jgi:sulfatase modifying factor 1